MDDTHESLRSQLLEMGVELITFSQYWYDDETRVRHFKAWSAAGTEVKLDDWPESDMFFWLKDLGIHDWHKVWGWQIRNDRLQMAAYDLQTTGRSRAWDLLEGEELEEYMKAAKQWGGHSHGDYTYSLSENLQQMLEAAQWSSTHEDALVWLDLFLRHEDGFVRASLAANPNIPEDTLVQLGYDSSPHVRNSVRMNPSIPEWLKQVLGRDLE